MTGFFTSPRIAWGPGAIEQLSGLGARKVVVVVDPTVARSLGHRRVVEELAKSDSVVEVVDDVANPDHWESVEALSARLHRHAPDWVVIVGGGRTLDGAKAARLRYERPEVPLESVTPVLDLPDPLRSRVAAIPTTSGSGSEVSWTADLVRAEGAPVEIAHRAMVPEWALVDPGFAATLPVEQRLDGALETAGQAVEAFLSAWANPFSDALALDALATVVQRLPHALRWSDDPEATSALHYAATSAGLAASNAQRGVAHALARALVPVTGLAYGRLLGIALPHVVDFDQPSARERVERLATVTTGPEDNHRLPFVARLRRLYESFRFPLTLRSAGFSPERLAESRAAILERTLRSPATLANPRIPSTGELEGLLDAVVGA
jgi:acetaldehyde dehydrogenase / alcohol dehydrogenase